MNFVLSISILAIFFFFSFQKLRGNPRYFAAIPAPSEVDWSEIEYAISNVLGTERVKVKFERYKHISLAMNLSSPDAVSQAISRPEICKFTVRFGNLGIYTHRLSDVLHVEVKEGPKMEITYLHKMILHLAEQKWKYQTFTPHITLAVGPPGSFDMFLKQKIIRFDANKLYSVDKVYLIQDRQTQGPRSFDLRSECKT
jgi:2'-5' RNA ligase